MNEDEPHTQWGSDVARRRPRTGKKILIHEEFDLVDFRRAYRSRNQNKVAEDDDGRVEKMIIRGIYLVHCPMCCLQGAGWLPNWEWSHMET